MQRYPRDNTTNRLPSRNTPDYEEVIKFTNGELFRFARNLVKEPLEADRIVGETLCTFLLHRTSFDSIGEIRAFMFVATRNACLNYLRYQQNTIKKLKGQPATTDITHEHILHELVRREIRVMLVRAIEKLPVKQREVIILHFMEGLGTKEIAARTGKDRQTIINQRNAALQQLKEIAKSWKVLRGFFD
jgi:RNA polymerase sigma factor (sigma-70 family)